MCACVHRFVSHFILFCVQSTHKTQTGPSKTITKWGEWKGNLHGLVVSGMNLENLKEALADKYNLNVPIVDRIIILYFVGSEDKRKLKYIETNDATLPTKNKLTLETTL